MHKYEALLLSHMERADKPLSNIGSLKVHSREQQWQQILVSRLLNHNHIHIVRHVFNIAETTKWMIINLKSK